MLRLTEAAKAASQKINVQPNVVFRIVKYDKLFGADYISELIRIGDPDLFIGNDWVIGGVREIQNQSPYISFNTGGGTTTSLTQKLSPDRKEGTTVTSMVVSLIDKNEEISRLISPGFELDDVLGTEVEVYLGFKDTAFPEDYEIIFRGLINDIDSGAGFVNFLLSSVEDKKRRNILLPQTAELAAAIPLGPISTITLNSTENFLLPINGPDGVLDASLSGFVKIDDEIFSFTGISGNTLTGVTRAQFGSLEAVHDAGREVKRGVRLQGRGIELALKLMLSGWQGPFVQNVQIKNFNQINPTLNIPNSIFFERVDLKKQYGLTIGDFVSVSGASNPANNFTLRKIRDIQLTNEGSYMVVDASAFVTELNTSALASFRSKYDTLPIGCKMSPAEVDVEQHEKLNEFFLNGFLFDLRDLFEIPSAKTLLDVELYAPMACFAIPRQGRASVTYSIGPIADQSIKKIDVSNVMNAPQLKLKRSLSTNFWNTVKYAYDHDVVKNEFLKVKTFSSALSKTQIPIGDKALEIESKGLRTGLGANLIENSANRLLTRYQFGAEYISGAKLIFGDGFPLEIGDVVLVDYGSLKLTDTTTGDRQGGQKFMEVLNKSLNIRTGEVVVDLVNTSFAVGDRFATISPGSKLASGSTTTRLNLKRSFATAEFDNEARAWQDYIGQDVIVYRPNWSVSATTKIQAVSLDPSALLVDPPLTFSPAENDIIALDFYPTDTDPATRQEIKLLHAFLCAVSPIVTGISQTEIEVPASQISKFVVGGLIKIFSPDYLLESPEAEIIAVDDVANRVEFDTPTGFPILNTYFAVTSGFKDESKWYRYI
jgi:hypothetical protein